MKACFLAEHGDGSFTEDHKGHEDGSLAEDS